MTYIKKMIMQGFKSFARRTEIEFDKEINTIVGPNGSGKSNIGDALCFVLGRLSIKSIRATKASNLIFMGSKDIKPSKEAYVELYFDNSNKTFPIEKDEIILKRIVRSNGQSIYKINEDTKNRADIIEMLAQAGIDPHGFNLIMQGQIQSIVRMHPEERRKIIEEVAGISIYENRKEKSLRELEKTEDRLKEITTILRERTAYLKNLENEKQQAQKYKDAEKIIKRAKASILNKKKQEKEKEVAQILKALQEKEDLKSMIKKEIDAFQTEIDERHSNINGINKHIKEASGTEQETLHNYIANLKAELEGLKVRKESHENRKLEIERRIEEMEKSIPELELDILELHKESPLVAKKSNELKKKKEEMTMIENERKKLLTNKSETESLRERIIDKEKQKTKLSTEAESLLKRLEEFEKELKYEHEEACLKAISLHKKDLENKKNIANEMHDEILEHEKSASIADVMIDRAQKMKISVDEINICPVCLSNITEKHKKHVHEDADQSITISSEKKEQSLETLKKAKEKKEEILKEIFLIESNLGISEKELILHKNIKEKKEQLNKFTEEEKNIQREISILQAKQSKLEEVSKELGKIEEKYDRKMLEIEEISARTIEDVDTTLLYKEREKENMQNVIKHSKKDLEEIEENIDSINKKIEDKTFDLEKKEDIERKMQEKFKKLFLERDELQQELQEKNLELSEKRQEQREVEDQANYLKIGKAKLDAEKEAIEMEISEFIGIELLPGSIQVLEEKVRKSKELLQNIGSINMKALEVYDQIKEEYDKIYERVQIVDKEREEIMKIIEEIDKKKRITFIKTFKAINTIFSENFSRLSSKGIAYLDIENKEDIFAGGLNIVVKLGKGKYFDVTSLSGGEQTLVALSLLFAVQEHKPYHFYIFDEIDAALDKRNSERLAEMLNQYMKAGQYIVITHNDAIISNSNVLYGVSMHEGISKILSLRLDEFPRKKIESEAENKEAIIKNEISGGESEIAKQSFAQEVSVDASLFDNEGL